MSGLEFIRVLYERGEWLSLVAIGIVLAGVAGMGWICITVVSLFRRHWMNVGYLLGRREEREVGAVADLCENCGAVAVCCDCEGTPLCQECAALPPSLEEIEAWYPEIVETLPDGTKRRIQG
jgi:hypothetical protein